MTDKKSDKATTIVNNYLKGAVAAGLVPMPLVDVVMISGIQLKMLHCLAKLYDQPFSNSQGKAVIAALLGSVLPLSLKTNLFSLCKSVPLLGQTVGLFGVSALAGATTYAIGKVFTQHFESGGTLLNFEPEQVRDYYDQQINEGKKIVQESFVGVKP